MSECVHPSHYEASALSECPDCAEPYYDAAPEPKATLVLRDNDTYGATFEMSWTSALPTIEQVEQAMVRAVLKMFRGNKTKAAIALGVDRRTLYRMLERMPAAQP